MEGVGIGTLVDALKINLFKQNSLPAAFEWFVARPDLSKLLDSFDPYFDDEADLQKNGILAFDHARTQNTSCQKDNESRAPDPRDVTKILQTVSCLLSCEIKDTNIKKCC